MSDINFDFRPHSLTEVIVSVKRLNELIGNLQKTEKQLSDLQEKYDRAVEVIKSSEVQFEPCGKCLCKCACEEEENE